MVTQFFKRLCYAMKKCSSINVQRLPPPTDQNLGHLAVGRIHRPLVALVKVDLEVSHYRLADLPRLLVPAAAAAAAVGGLRFDFELDFVLVLVLVQPVFVADNRPKKPKPQPSRQ